MKQLLLLVFASILLALPTQAQLSATPSAAPLYGTASVVQGGTNYWYLALCDGITPNPQYRYLEENGQKRRFADEAAVLNYLYSLGWDVFPNGTRGDAADFRYLLKRRNP
ncbi:hypothetical protein [Hymenobacter cavernae]|uniref:Uncharacterized protein n=1 Tax=Hymenobacter cavernae TaxID=2044852 RepID=A0ABQ1UYI3_9BACT|nr:hypothetical protein [Hymenobacter cavernae]GGF28191.1 hypothetical protein GCM10011383_44930 [Hymenobacter cavernae]